VSFEEGGLGDELCDDLVSLFSGKSIFFDYRVGSFEVVRKGNE